MREPTTCKESIDMLAGSQRRVTMDLPPMTQNMMEHNIDSTPDDGYPLRILRAYRFDCNSRWKVSGSMEEKALWDLMNEHQAQRAAILDRAIAWLEKMEDKS